MAINWKFWQRNANNLTFRDADSGALAEIFGAYPSIAGPSVTAESAMRVSAVHACVRILSGTISTLPLHLYRRTAAGREKLSDVNLWWLFNEQPTARYSAATMWEHVVKSMLLRGDAICYLARDNSGNVREVIPIAREAVVIEREGGRLKYAIQDDQRFIGLDQDDVLHFPGLGFDGVCGQSVIGHYAGNQAVGAAMAAEDHAARFFGRGTMQRFALMQKGRMTPAPLERMRAQWTNTYGGTDNAQKPLILVEGTEIKELSLSASDAQLLESRSFSVEDIARFFGVPPHMIGHTEKTTSWGSGIEQMSVGFVTYTLQPYLNRIEQELNRKLFRTAGRFFEFETKGLMRGDSAAQAAYFTAALGGSGGPGWMTPNEVRALNNLPALPGGDELSSWATPADPQVDQPVSDPAANDGDMAAANAAGVMTVNEAREKAGLQPLEGPAGSRLVGAMAGAEYRFDEITKKMERIG